MSLNYLLFTSEVKSWFMLLKDGCERWGKIAAGKLQARIQGATLVFGGFDTDAMDQHGTTFLVSFKIDQEVEDFNINNNTFMLIMTINDHITNYN